MARVNKSVNQSFIENEVKNTISQLTGTYKLSLNNPRLRKLSSKISTVIDLMNTLFEFKDVDETVVR